MDDRIKYVDNAFALLVGVTDYSAYDRSAGKSPGTSDLAGGNNDVRAYYRLCRALGIRPENIHVLTSPKLAANELGEGVRVGYSGEATRAEIEAQVKWLAGVLAHAPGDEKAPVGLFTYSGHGDFSDGHLALCPSDVQVAQGKPAGADLENALGFPALRSIIDRSPGAAESLTVLVDSCHAGAAVEARQGRRASLTGRAHSKEVPVVRVGERMLMAAGAGETACQGRFGDVAHGAFTWAMTVVADQWRVIAEEGMDHLTISHEDMRTRAQALLDALSFPQRIALAGPPGVEKTLFFHRGVIDAADAKAGAPDRQRASIQLDPGSNMPGAQYTLYTLTITYTPTNQPMTSAKATVLSVAPTAEDSPNYGTDTQPINYSPGQEYWYLGANFAFGMNYTDDPTRALTITSSVATAWPASTSNPLPGTTTFLEGNSATWGTTAPPGTINWLYSYSAGNGWGAGFAINATGSTVYWSLLGSRSNPPGVGTMVAVLIPTYTFTTGSIKLGKSESWTYSSSS